MPGRAADRARGVHAEHRLAVRAERIGEVQLRLHHALEQIGRLAQHDRVDVGPVELRVLERAGRRLTHESAERDVPTPRLVLRLADADDRTRVSWRHHGSPPVQ